MTQMTRLDTVGVAECAARSTGCLRVSLSRRVSSRSSGIFLWMSSGIFDVIVVVAAAVVVSASAAFIVVATASFVAAAVVVTNVVVLAAASASATSATTAVGGGAVVFDDDVVNTASYCFILSLYLQGAH